jgi:hypothetical protein
MSHKHTKELYDATTRALEATNWDADAAAKLMLKQGWGERMMAKDGAAPAKPKRRRTKKTAPNGADSR